jgi:hypothetical protein
MPGLVSFDTNFEKMRRNKNANSAEKKASEQTQTDDKILLSLFEINIIRYSLFIDNIKPEQIDPFFMIDFMSLPEDYFLEENIQKYGIIHLAIHSLKHKNYIKAIFSLKKSFCFATVLIIFIRHSSEVKYCFKIVK